MGSLSDAELQALVRAVLDKIDRERPSSQLIPARVVAYSTALGFANTFAVVRLVGDPPDRTMQVPSLVDGVLSKDDMVMVMFDPPEGAYVFARIPDGSCPTTIRLRIVVSEEV